MLVSAIDGRAEVTDAIASGVAKGTQLNQSIELRPLSWLPFLARHTLATDETRIRTDGARRADGRRSVSIRVSSVAETSS